MAQDFAQRASLRDVPRCRLFIGGAWEDGVETVAVPDKFLGRVCSEADLPSSLTGTGFITIT